MIYEYAGNIDIDTLRLEQSFRILADIQTMAQSQIYNTVNKLSFDNAFKRMIRALMGYNNVLLRQYITILDRIVPRVCDIIKSKDIINLDIISSEDKQRLIDMIEWVRKIYYDVLVNEKTFKNNNASLLIGTLDELLNEMDQLLYHIITMTDHKSDEKQESKPEKQTKGYIEINQYMIDYF